MQMAVYVGQRYVQSNQWLKHLWDHENKFETGVVRANEC